MAGYEIKGSGTFPGIPITDMYGQASPDFHDAAMITLELDASASQTNPKRVWGGQGGYIDFHGPAGGGVWSIQWGQMTGTRNPQTPPLYEGVYDLNDKVYLFAMRTGTTPANDQLTVYWTHTTNIATSQYSNLNVLYNNTWEEAQDSGTVTPTRDWDETPSSNDDNPFNMNPQGGAFAELEDFSESDDIDLSNQDVPEIICSGFLTAYIMDSNDIARLGQCIFTSNTWTNLQNKFNGVGNPIDYIISAIEVPWSPYEASGAKNFNLGGVDVVNQSGNPVSFSYMLKRYVKFNCGTVTLLEAWGSEKDYSETEVSIFLPYVGVKDLDASIVMNSSITVKGCIDIWTGDVFYALYVSNAQRKNKYFVSSGIVYRFQGTSGKQIPIGRVDDSSQIMASFGAIASMGAGLAMGNPMMAVGGAAGLIGAAAMGPKVSIGSGVGGSIARADVNYPYLIIRRSVPVYPQEWRAHFGAPRYQTFRLGDLTGYVKCADVHVENVVGLNDKERAMLESVLKAGVYV